MKSERLRIALGFAVISTVWGSTWFAIKIGLETMPPFLSAGIRFLVASGILFAIIRARGLRVPLSAEAWKTYLAIGILSFSIPFALVYWGEQFIPSSLCSILFGAFPFWVALFSHFLSGTEKMDAYKFAGTLVGFAGVVVIFSPELTWTGSRGMAGMAAILAATLLQAYALIPIKKHGREISPFVMNFVGMTMGTVSLLSLAAAFERDRPVVLTVSGAGSILYLAVFGSVVAFVTYYWLLKRVQAVYLSLSSFINPIIAVILGAAILGERLDRSVLAGAALVLVGIAVTNWRALAARSTRSAVYTQRREQ